MQPGFHIFLCVVRLPLIGGKIKLDWKIITSRGKERNTKWGPPDNYFKIANIGKD